MPGKSVKVNRKECIVMSKNDTFRSFRDLDASRFRKEGDAQPRKKPAPPKKDTAVPDIGDESAMFLAAVAGNVDVSRKHTPDDADAPAPRPGKNTVAKHSAAKNSVGRAALPPFPLPEKPLPVPQAETSPPPVIKKPQDADIFSRAMDGVRPIRARGRDMAPPSKSLPPPNNGALADMDELLSGKLEFSLEYTDEFVQGHVLGLDPVVLEKLKAGAYSPEGHVDLHGQNMEQAYATLVAFIRHGYQAGKRHLVVITGRGKNSPGGTPVLRERVQSWFTRDPFKRVVLGFCSAKPGDGGAGALYLLLRKRKKSQGKIVWDNKPSEEELLL